MIVPRLRARVPNRVHWALVWLPILVWVLHLTFVAAMVHFTCSHPGLRWTLYVGTLVPAAVVAAGIALAVVSARAVTGADPEGPSVDDQVAFLAHMAVAIGIVNLVLILAEGVVIPFLSSCA